MFEPFPGYGAGLHKLIVARHLLQLLLPLLLLLGPPLRPLLQPQLGIDQFTMRISKKRA